jgi:hypothetical protein
MGRAAYSGGVIRQRGRALAWLVVLAACTSTPQRINTIRAATAYAAVVRWQIDQPAPVTTTAGKPIVYIARAAGEHIDAGEQADVVAAVKDVAVVRFADIRDEALDVDVDGRPVKDHGVLLLVGPVTESQPPVEVAVEVYRSSTDDESFVVRIDGAKAGFEVTASTLMRSG